jgi:hypothetical protein
MRLADIKVECIFALSNGNAVIRQKVRYRILRAKGANSAMVQASAGSFDYVCRKRATYSAQDDDSVVT